jgi:hypothetical protein
MIQNISTNQFAPAAPTASVPAGGAPAADQAAAAPQDAVSLTGAQAAGAPSAEGGGVPSSASLAALAVGPIPDFAPLSGIITHVLAGELGGDMVNRLRERLGSSLESRGIGYQGPRGGYGSSGGNMVWIRDYSPTYVRQADGTTQVVRFLSPVPERNNYDGATYIPVRGPSPEHRFFRKPGVTTGGGQWMVSRTVPLDHELGNQIATGRHVFVSERLIQDNAQPGTHQMQQAGYRSRTADETTHELASAYGMADDQVVVLPRMPGEATGHVDLYMMALSPDRIMIPEVRQEALDLLGSDQEKQLGGQVRSFLDERAEQVRGLGYHVDRLPMMAPVNVVTLPSGDLHGDFYSPANSLLQNTEQGQAVMVPTFNPQGYSEPYQQTNQRYTEEWKSFFQGAGWEPQAVDATELGKGHGLFRCITQPVPQVD